MSSVSTFGADVQAVPGTPVKGCKCLVCGLNRLDAKEKAAESVPVNGKPTTLAEFVDDEARAYRAQGTTEGDFLADQLDRIGQLIRWTSAKTPAEFTDRMDVWDTEIQEQSYNRGYNEGVAMASSRRIA